MSGNIALGLMVRDKVTGFVGVADNRAEFMHGCTRYYIQPQINRDGAVPEGALFDEPQIEIIQPVNAVVPEPVEPPVRCAMGQKVRDPITSIEGIVCGRAVYLNGCSRVYVVPKMNDRGISLEYWTDEERVEIVGANLLLVAKPEISEPPKERTGGPAPSCSKQPSQHKK